MILSDEDVHAPTALVLYLVGMDPPVAHTQDAALDKQVQKGKQDLRTLRREPAVRRYSETRGLDGLQPYKEESQSPITSDGLSTRLRLAPLHL